MGCKLTEYPAWMNRVREANQPRERMRFLLKYAALMGTPEASISALSEALGMHVYSLGASLSQGRYDKGLPVSLILKIEDLIGFDVIPRDMMNPKAYGQPR